MRLAPGSGMKGSPLTCYWALLNRTLIVAAQRLCVPQLRALPDERVGWVEVYDKVFFFEEWAKARCHTDADESPADRQPLRVSVDKDRSQVYFVLKPKFLVVKKNQRVTIVALWP